MLRKDREIINTEEITAILKKCDTLSIAFKGEEYPYVVAVSFGVIEENGSAVIYFHGAKQGLKTDMIKISPKVCFEGHVFHKVEQTKYGITTRYESIIGFGVIKQADEDEIITALKSITEHYGFYDYPVGRCKGLAMTAVYKIEINKLTGKRNLLD